ncbi:MAG TPA: glycosyltransferase family A protein, partial [Planctomycetaceae bacterium]|nr:glycosyltransferase family A protein [Planctomycetaceae bacterium]
MKISTIIPVYNGAAYLRRAVDSLLATRDPDLEIVIVDDGSQDDSAAIADALQHEFPGCVRFARHPRGENRGVSATRNAGIQVSTGEWLALLDADDYVRPHRFDSARSILSTRPEVDGVYQLCEMEFATEQARQTWWNTKTTFGFEQPIDPQELIFALLRGACWATSAVVFRRSLLGRTGMFDPQLKLAE